ncbi:MAG: DUF4783 domain-containing protein [Saprospiraceae bacterium]|nr:DUF4783 domain-containing protein [Saprospiraceae bacterium]
MKMFVWLILLLPIAGAAQADFSGMAKALGSGNADALGQYFDQNVEISMSDNEDVYAKAQAINMVRQFFTQNAPRSFQQMHQGASKGSDAQYCIGNLTTASGTFRVYLYAKTSAGKFLIQEIRFDKGN